MTNTAKRYDEACSKFDARSYCQKIRDTREFGHAFIPMNHAKFLARSVSLYPNKEAVIDENFRCTYKELDNRINRFANALLNAGIEKYDRIAYLEGNTHELLEGYLTFPKIGTILLPMNIRLGPDALEYMLNDAIARVLIFDKEFLPIIQRLIKKIPVEKFIVTHSDEPVEIGGGVEAEPYDAFLNKGPSSPPPVDYLRDIDENDISELFYTSDTTGVLEGVMYTYREIYLHALEVIASWHIQESDRILHTVPLFHTNGWGTPQFLTAMGGTHIMFKRFKPKRWLELVEKERVTKSFMTPTMWGMIINYVRAYPEEEYDLSSLDWGIAGGATMSVGLCKDVEEVIGAEIITGYGSTETCPVVSQAHVKDAKGHYILPEFEKLSQEELRLLRCRTGYPMVGVEVKIVDKNGTPVKSNATQVGAEYVRGNIVMRGYWRKPDKTKESIDENGWFNIEDMCTLDQYGYMLLVDRSKDIIISGGENIASVEVERCIREHPAVSECAVVGKPDEEWGEIVHAVIVLKQSTKATGEEIIRHCRDRLARFKCPKSVGFVNELPKTATGKILKRTIRDELKGNPKEE